MKFKFHVPTQQFGFLEIEGEHDDLRLMEEYYNKYAEKGIAFKGSGTTYSLLTSFTGEKILFDKEHHKYLDENRVPLVSGSQYAKSFEDPFNSEFIAGKVSKSSGVPASIILDMWAANSVISTTFGKALHSAMEQYFRYKDYGTPKNYHLTKNPFLNQVVTTFPLINEVILPELLVSDVKNKMVGQIDGLRLIRDTENAKEAHIIDYKSDADIGKNLLKHFRQLSFYATILINHGWSIPELEVWNYTNGWTKFSSPVLAIT